MLQWGARAGLTAEELARHGAEGMALADSLGDRALAAMIRGFSGSAMFWAGDLHGGLGGYLDAARRAEEIDEPDQPATWEGAAALPLTFVGPLAEGLAYADRYIRFCAGDPERGVAFLGYSFLAAAHMLRAGLLARMGRLPDAEVDAERALALVRSRTLPEWLCWTLATLPLLAWLTGDGRDVSAEVAELLQVAEETGNVASLVVALEGTALGHLMGGRCDDAADACERALSMSRARRSGLFLEASLLAHLALARLGAGDQAAAASAAGEAVEVARRQGARVLECLALLTRGRVGRCSGAPPDAVAADLAAALTLVAEVGSLTYEPFIREELGRLRGDESELREAVRLYAAIGAPGHARRLSTELAGSLPPASAAPGKPGLLE